MLILSCRLTLPRPQRYPGRSSGPLLALARSPACAARLFLVHLTKSRVFSREHPAFRQVDGQIANRPAEATPGGRSDARGRSNTQRPKRCLPKQRQGSGRRQRPKAETPAQRLQRAPAATRATRAQSLCGRGYSHSMVPGGFGVTSSTTRFTSATWLVIWCEMCASTS